MTIASNLTAAFQRVGTEFRAIRALISGSETGNAAALQTSATNLVEAINEVRAIGLSKAAIDDVNLSALTTWSSQKTNSEIQAAVAALVNGAPGALDTLQELAAALGNDPDLQNSLLTQIALKANAADVYTRAEADALLATAATKQAVRVFASTDATIYQDSSAVPQPDPTGLTGWYFKNTGSPSKFNWYPYSGVGVQRVSEITSIYAVIKFISVASMPILGIYTKKTGAGDAGSWYRSRYVRATYAETPVAGTTYLVVFGEDPGIYPELPRLHLTATQSSNSVGPRDPSEEILTYSWGSNSAAAAGQVELTGVEMGHTIGGVSMAGSLVHIGGTKPEVDALSAEVTAASGADYVATFNAAIA